MSIGARTADESSSGLWAALGREGWRLICLKGNHEDIMWQTCLGMVPDCDWWLTNGGGATLISYGQAQGQEVDVAVVPDEHLRWIERLPLLHVDRHRIFVHAGIDPNLSLDEQDSQRVIWKIYDDRSEGGHGQRHVVHGHHQHANGPILKKNRTNLDTFAWYTGRLVIGVFDDDMPARPLKFWKRMVSLQERSERLDRDVFSSRHLLHDAPVWC